MLITSIFFYKCTLDSTLDISLTKWLKQLWWIILSKDESFSKLRLSAHTRVKSRWTSIPMFLVKTLSSVQATSVSSSASMFAAKLAKDILMPFWLTSPANLYIFLSWFKIFSPVCHVCLLAHRHQCSTYTLSDTHIICLKCIHIHPLWYIVVSYYTFSPFMHNIFAFHNTQIYLLWYIRLLWH